MLQVSELIILPLIKYLNKQRNSVKFSPIFKAIN
jgi:hypothetical protein